MSARPQAARGLRREVPALLAGSLLVFVALAAFTLYSYREAVAALIEERRSEALRLAGRAADELRRSGAASSESLARALPPGAAAALLDDRGREVVSFGYDGPADLEPAAVAPVAGGPAGIGPLDPERGTVVALVPFRQGAQRRLLRVDLPAATLAARQRGLAVLTPVVLGLSIAAGVLLALFTLALERPYRQLLARARSFGSDEAPAGDELGFLVATFDRALAAVAAERGGDLARLHETLGQQLDSGLLLLARDGAVLAANPVAVALLGLRAGFEGEPLERALAAHPGFAARLGDAVVRGASVPRAEARLGGRESARSLGLVIEALRRPDGETRGFLVLFADVTELERRAARDRLAAGLAQLGELSAGVAHELRNGIATLMGYLQLAGRQPLPDRAGEYLAEAGRELDAMRRVVDDFLAFARPGTARLAQVDLRAVVERSAADPALGGFAIERAVPATPALVTGDALLLERAVKNLLANATQAERGAGRDGPIELRLEPLAAGYRISIADRGPGLPPGPVEALFDPFVSGRAGGAGLGLALARRIVLLHGGSLGLEARPGGGVLARIEIPSGDSVTSSSAAAPEGPGPGTTDRSTSP